MKNTHVHNLNVYNFFRGLSLIISISLLATGCFSSYISAPKDKIQVSKELSINEDKATVKNVVNASGKVVFDTIQKVLKTPTETVIFYHKNSITQQYHHQGLFNYAGKPYVKTGAMVSSTLSLSRGRKSLKLTFVYITPQKDNKTEIAIGGVRSSREPDKLLQDIVSQLDGDTSSNNGNQNAGAGKSNNPSEEAAKKALDNLDKQLDKQQ